MRPQERGRGIAQPNPSIILFAFFTSATLKHMGHAEKHTGQAEIVIDSPTYFPH
jgi:hypothetical protein